MVRLFALLMCLTTTAVAADSAYDAYRDETLGWNKVHNFGPAKKGLKVDDKVYSPVQISIAGQLVNWMQASYLPKGGLGDIRKTALERIGLYNTYNSAAAITEQVRCRVLRWFSRHGRLDPDDARDMLA